MYCSILSTKYMYFKYILYFFPNWTAASVNSCFVRFIFVQELVRQQKAIIIVPQGSDLFLKHSSELPQLIQPLNINFM